jgi:hypothetical protein
MWYAGGKAVAKGVPRIFRQDQRIIGTFLDLAS